MQESDFYQEIADKLMHEIGYALPMADEPLACVVHNRQYPSLTEMVGQIESVLGAPSGFNKEYVPRLRVDLVAGFKKQGRTSLCLFEVKYADSLNLMDFSQLIGYMNVAKHIKAGVLLLVQKSAGKAMLSNDFSSILDLGNAPLNVRSVIKSAAKTPEFSFNIGILKLVPDNGFEWCNTEKHCGISNFDDLVGAA